jgi:hypothetical protein
MGKHTHTHTYKYRNGKPLPPELLKMMGVKGRSETYEEKVMRWTVAAKRLRDEIGPFAASLGLPRLGEQLWFYIDGRIATRRVEPTALKNAVMDRIYLYDARMDMAEAWLEKRRVRKFVEQLPMRGSVPIAIDSRMRPVQAAAAVPVEDGKTFTFPAYRPEQTEWKSGPRLTEVDSVAAILRGAALVNQAGTAAQRAGLPSEEAVLVRAARDLRNIAAGTVATSEVPAVIAAVQPVIDALRGANQDVSADSLQTAIADLAATAVTVTATNADRVRGSVDVSEDLLADRERFEPDTTAPRGADPTGSGA